MSMQQQQQQQQRLPLLFPPSIRPTTIVYKNDKLGIWTFEQPFITTTNIRTRMSVFRTADKSIVIYSPIAATPECVELVKSLTGGALPSYIIMQSNAIDHTIFLDSWRKAVPSAQVFAVNPSTADGDLPLLLPGTDTDEINLPFLIQQQSQSNKNNCVCQAALLDVAPFFREVVLYHKPSKSLLCADAVWRVVSPIFSPNVIAGTGWTIFGVSGKSNFPYWFYFPRRKKQQVQQFLAQVESWGEIQRVLPGHLDAIPSTVSDVDEGKVEKDPSFVKRTFLQSFDFIVE